MRLNNLARVVIVLGLIVIITSYESNNLIKFIALIMVISSLIINYTLRNTNNENYN